MVRHLGLAILSTLATPVFAGARLSATRLQSCAGDVCVEVTAERAFEGSLRPGVLFMRPRLTIVDRSKPRSRSRFTAESIFHDPDSDRLMIRGLTTARRGPTTDGYYELSEGRLYRVGG